MRAEAAAYLSSVIRVSLPLGMALASVLSYASQMRAQEPPAPKLASSGVLSAAIESLGDLDYDKRASASRLIRRTPGAQAVPALLEAVAGHADGYVRYRALVLLTGFHSSRTEGAMRSALTSPNDRVRAVAYMYCERAPNPSITNTLLAALEAEHSEFVRPLLVRALAVLRDDPRVQKALVREANRGEDFFRSSVIEALGDHRIDSAYAALAAIATQGGPLQDDAVLALGKIRDGRAVELLMELERSGPASVQPVATAGLCLLGLACASREQRLLAALESSGAPSEVEAVQRAATSSLAALAGSGRESALEALLGAGVGAAEPLRSRVALAVATVALRDAPLMLTFLEKNRHDGDAIQLLVEGFEMLDEDFAKEQFFALLRGNYWRAVEGSSTRDLMQTLIGLLDF